MKTRFLFPHQYKKIGWVLFSSSLILLTYLWLTEFNFEDFLKIPVFAILDNSNLFKNGTYFSIIENGILDELLTILAIIGGFLVAFSKAKIEDEYISKIRLEALSLATYINYAFIILATLFIYGLDYLNIIIFNLFTTLLFFIVIFHYKLAKLKKVSL